MMYVDNLNAFIRMASTHPKAAGKTFVVSDRVPVSTPELVRAIAAADGCQARLFPMHRAMMGLGTRLVGRADDYRKLTSSMVIDQGRAVALLGWKPPYELNTALSHVLPRIPRSSARGLRFG